jgi:hypothetical protein
MSQRAPTALLVVALVASAALLFSYVSDLIFIGDSWEFLAGRPDWSASTFLEPFNEHAVLITAFIFKLLLALFGMDSALPFYAVSIALFLLCAVLMFVYMRRRVGDWLALCGAVLLLFMGAAFEDLLWEFQMCFFGSIAAGLGAFLALDREDRAGDRLACLLLLVSTAFSSLGVPFVVATMARVWLDPSQRRKRAYVPLLPLALYLAWWVGSGHSAGSEVGPGDIPDLPGYVFEAGAAGIAALLGQQPVDGDGKPPLLAQVLVVVLGSSLIYWLGRRRQLPPGLIVALVLTFSFWGLLALDRGPQRFSSRFQYPSGVFLLIIVAEALRGVRLPRGATLAVAVITAAAVVGGVSLLEQGYRVRWQVASANIRATLAAIELAGPSAQPSYEIHFPPSIDLPVRTYREARQKHGTPAFSEAELISAKETDRRLADRTLVGALGLGLLAPADASEPVRCRQITPPPDAQSEASLPSAGGFEVTNLTNETVTVRVGRFSDEAPARVGELGARARASLHLPADRSERAWRLGIKGGPVRLCAVR